SGDTLQIDDGALYTSLHRLEKRGLLEAEWGMSESRRRAKFYRLTAEGVRRLTQETMSWGRYASAVFRVLGTPLPDEGARRT
ncbi:MAG TPA: helix-turn-helix transcriptional regulator, partial [Longimicrobiales bacterium]|nr:helix-turn-helix transcriptional regulator [Longimicrobiales bacterium]